MAANKASRPLTDLSPSAPIRLNRLIAEAGLASRRGADQLILDGEVSVNGKRVTTLGHKVNPQADRIFVKGKPLKPQEPKVYIAFHKPENVITSMDDPHGRKTVADYFHKLRVRLFPVGRLDWDSEGLLLLTNDGDFAQKIMHPKGEVHKTYLVKLSGSPSDQQIQRLLRGVSIPQGGRVRALKVERFSQGSKQYDWIKIVIAEGKHRQVREMCAKIGFDVRKLRRVAIGQLRLGQLKKGEFKVLGPKDIQKALSSDLPLAGKPQSKAKAKARKKTTKTWSKR